jgi:nucleoside-diphosphate-sugar epimerase
VARVLIAGCGYVGAALARRLAAAGHEVVGLRRRPVAIPGVRVVALDLLRGEDLGAIPDGMDRVVYAVSAGGGDEVAYRAAYVTGLANLTSELARRGERPARLVFTSSTGVYGQSDGEWVDEASPTAPTHFSGRILLEGESLVLASGAPAVVLRLGGIYGPERTRVIDSVRSGEALCRDGEPVWTNRIHRDDAAGAIAHLLFADAPPSFVVGVDHEPADQCEVFRWLADQLGVPPPRRGSGPTRDLRYERSNKRCRNTRLLGTGFRFAYPTFREGYADLIRHPVAGG